MSVFSDLATLLNVAGVTALVGTRIYAGHADETEAVPYIVFEQVTGNAQNQLQGDALFVNRRMQINCWDSTLVGARAIKEAVVAALSGTGYIISEDYFYDSTVQKHRASVDWKRIGALS